MSLVLEKLQYVRPYSLEATINKSYYKYNGRSVGLGHRYVMTTLFCNKKFISDSYVYVSFT